MARLTIDGVGIHYELLGEAGAPAVALTPGGRFSIETAGLRELGQALVSGGKRVLLWDRPNCGMSDVCLDENRPESVLHADTLAGLIKALDLGPTALAGGSAGARVSLLTGARHPELISHLVLWWISGGAIGLLQLAMIYCGEAAHAVNTGGMQALENVFAWKEQMEINSAARKALLEMDPKYFVDLMQKWAAAYVPSPETPVPGMKPDYFFRLKMPVLIFNSGTTDLSHTRATTEWVHKLIPHSLLSEPPWPDDEWNERTRSVNDSDAAGLFVNWPKLAPAIVEFSSRIKIPEEHSS